MIKIEGGRGRKIFGIVQSRKLEKNINLVKK